MPVQHTAQRPLWIKQNPSNCAFERAAWLVVVLGVLASPCPGLGAAVWGEWPARRFFQHRDRWRRWSGVDICTQTHTQSGNLFLLSGWYCRVNPALPKVKWSAHEMEKTNTQTILILNNFNKINIIIFMRGTEKCDMTSNGHFSPLRKSRRH